MIAQRLTNVLIVVLLLSRTLSAQIPIEEEKHFLPDTLMELTTLDSTLKLDIRYAGSSNFMHRPMYTQARAFLQKAVAEALVRVHRKLHQWGCGLLIFDGYRPWSVTKKFWDETPPEKHNFVADPQKGSKHNRGCAVDVSLFSLKTGKEISMPSPYDDFSEKAYPTYSGGSAANRRVRDLLRRTMESEGFTVNAFEWWHFDYRQWEKHRILDISFEKLSRTQ